MNTNVRSFYDLSTAHLSPDARRWLETQAYANALQQAGTRCYPVAAFMHGWMMWVPNGENLADPEYEDVVPRDLHDACVEARIYGCDYMLFDADAPIIGTLPVWDEDETSTEGLSEEEQKALAAVPKQTPAEIIRESLARTDAKVIHPEDGMPMETDAYGGDIDTFLQSHPDTAVVVKGMAVLTAKGIALLLQRHGIDHGLINILMNRLREAAETRVAATRKRNAIAELQTACVDILVEIDAEIEQRQTGGNDEDWEALQEKSNRLSKAVRALS